MSGVLFVNPHSGKGGPSVDELESAARTLAVRVHVLGEGDDPGELAREAEVEVLGMAGGDGSLGVYARLVHRREQRRQRREAFARMRALLVSLKDRRRMERFVVDGEPLRATVVLVANNEYRLDLFSIGERERVDEGTLAIHAARGLRRLR